MSVKIQNQKLQAIGKKKPVQKVVLNENQQKLGITQTKKEKKTKTK